jgi:hypothetical protein
MVMGVVAAGVASQEVVECQAGAMVVDGRKSADRNGMVAGSMSDDGQTKRIHLG